MDNPNLKILGCDIYWCFSTSRAHALDLYLSFANRTTHQAKFINSTSESFVNTHTEQDAANYY